MARRVISEVPHKLPNPFMPRANWVDSFETTVREPGFTAEAAVDAMFSAKPPLWVRALNGLRNAIVGVIGLKNGEISVDAEKVGAFPIVERSDRVVVFGFDDWHLNFLIAVEAHPTSTVSVTTLVERKHWFGYAYIFLITPFHKLIVRTMMARLPV